MTEIKKEKIIEKCSYCGKTSDHLEKHTVWINGFREEKLFCDEDCAQMAQMGAEG